VATLAYEVEVLYRLLKGGLTFRHGELEAPQAPGLGIDVDWDAVERFRRG
jgi:L-alanine-DL-glutamate epimerase-like enolase superfamily enzyme